MSESSFRALSQDDLKFAKDEPSKIFLDLDSGIQGCQWHRMVIDADISDNAAVTIFFYASDDKAESRHNEDYWNDCTIFTGKYRDALLQSKKGEPVLGQYLNIKVMLSCNGPKENYSAGNEETQDLHLKSIKFYYPRSSYLRYLPAIYQRDEDSRRFLERFLSIFESSLMESDEIISNIQRYFDPMAAPDEFIPWLAGWLSLDLYEQAEKRNRDLILHATELYRWKGTATGLAMLGKTLTGCECIVKEYENNVFRTFGSESYEEYGPFHRNISRTLDTTKAELLKNIGTYQDEVQYISGRAGPRGSSCGFVGDLDDENCLEYYPNSVGLFLFLGDKKSLVEGEVKLLKRIIRSFLPVFVSIRIEIIQSLFFSSFDTSQVKEEGDEIEISVKTEVHEAAIEDRYWNSVDWFLTKTYPDDQGSHTWYGDLKFRTFHDQISEYGKSGPGNLLIKKKAPAFREV